MRETCESVTNARLVRAEKSRDKTSLILAVSLIYTCMKLNSDT